MDVKGESGVNIRPLRKSDRLRQARKIFRKSYLYYPSMRKKSKSNRRAKVSKFAKMLRPKNRPNRTPPSNLVSTDLRRSTRKRKVTTHFAEYENDTDSSRTDDIDLVYHSSRRIKHKAAQDELSAPRRHKRISNTEPAPRREGLRPRRSAPWSREESYQESDDNEDTSDSDVPVDQDETENVNDVDGAGDDDVESEDGNDMEEEEEGEDGEDEDGEEQDGKRRYDLRNRADVRRSSPEKERKLRPRSPRRVLHQGMSSKNNKESRRGGRVHKRHRFARDDDSDDSLLVDELDQGPPVPWTRSGNRNGAPLLFGGLDLHGTSPWGLNASASGWGHQGDGIMSTSAGIQTAGPSSKGGADIQPLQVDGSVSFDDIGGLSEYIDALKEMVFFPLLYPDFFANYHITPPRGVLLCGPPGTGKTLIARALACAASKAGQKVSFYMRKGADVLSKWVGEAERQLKLLFEEAQRNQPSIIFFDEIDGLAPVRSSKQEQIHNSIVSTLLALMDGLDSRGQVVLIGATNRIDAIDGALRRPGRFDREFVFSLPGCEARAEILDIHTRKWKEPPSKSLKMELAATCVGYCGADLKALCTEAAIRAFREKYPQVYTSDDKFLIDVDSIRIEKYHFLEAMSSITPAAHRGSIVLSRPLSSVVAPCLCRHFNKIMELISDIFPSLSSSDMTRLSVFSFGSSIPLVYRPRLLICGDEGAGLDHVGPAILHELEKFPVHSLGMASLLSDPGAKTPEEALVHIFGEARKTTPSILYLPQFHLWWDTAHEQLKVVLLTLLDELPSNFPILVLGTSSVAYADLEEMTSSVFSLLNAYQVDIPTIDDRSKFVEKLVEAVLSIPSEESSKSKVHLSLPELPKVPTEVGMPKASELRAKAEAEQHALRRLRMCFRDVCNRILYDKRFSVFHYPVTDEDAPNYHSIVQNPMDIATMLQRVDCGHYLLCSTFFQDVDLIVANAKAYNGEDYTGSRIVSRACELRDSVQGMLSQMDPSLVSFCDKIAAQGGPVPLPDDMRDLGFPPAPVVQPVSVTRMSARLRNAQPEVNISQSYEALKRPKKSSDADKPATNSDQTMEERSEAVEELDLHNLPSCQPKPHLPPQDCNSNPISSPKEPENNPVISDIPVPSVPTFPVAIEDAHDNSGKINNCDLSGEIIYVKQRLIEQTKNYGVPQLERLYTRVIKGVITDKNRGVGEDHRCSILKFLSKFSDDDSNF